MRYNPLSKNTYINHRKNFASKLPKEGMAIFNSNDIMPTNADGTMNFRQNNDLLYLSGVDQEESILVIFPEAFLPAHREILFIKETSPSIAIWEGDKLTKEQATELSGVKTVFWLDQFETVLKTLMSNAQVVFLNSNEHTRQSNEVETRDMRFNKWIMNEYPLHKYDRATPILHRLRSVKSVEEIEQMKKACDITEAGFRRVLKFVRPRVMEYEIEAEFMHEFLRSRSRGFAYAPIIASGSNACVLHYIDNNMPCNDGDLILMDVGAEYGNYASDMTRTIPVNGKFTKRQRAVYDSVLHVMRACEKLLKPGIFLNEYHNKVNLVMQDELIKLGLLTEDEIENQDPSNPAFRKYFMHGVSHFIGLDVHDVGLWTEPIEAGMVFTIEPGIYIRDERIGIRLENDYLVGEKKNINLMAHIPIEADDIEALMAEE